MQLCASKEYWSMVSVIRAITFYMTHSIHYHNVPGESIINVDFARMKDVELSCCKHLRECSVARY